MRVNFVNNFNTETEGGKIFILPERELVAEVFLKNYRYIDFYVLKEKTGEYKNYGRTIFYKRTKPEIKKNYPLRPIYSSNNLLVCQNCDRKIIKVYKDKLINYSVKIICACGAEYDIRTGKEATNYDKSLFKILY